MSKIYVGCALNTAPKDFLERVVDFKERLRAADYEVLEFVGKAAASNVEVYDHDIACVRACDYFVAIADHPSTGLGIELREADLLATPTLVVAQRGNAISRMVLGAAERYDFAATYEYNELSDVVTEVNRWHSAE